MTITWDPNKAEKNLEKHGVSFDEAATVFFNGPTLSMEDTDHDEHRMVILGFSAKARMLVVVYVERIENEIRIISARKAEPSERKEYEKRVRLF